MGMFDSVDFFCPNCNEVLETQSKAGPCGLNKYRCDSIPANIAMDLKGDKLYCQVCDLTYTITGNIPRVSLFLTLFKLENGYD